MILTHFSDKPIKIDYDRAYVQPNGWTKPNGLWLSDESDLGWLQWAKKEGFNPGGFEYSTRFGLEGNFLHLSTFGALVDFGKEFDHGGIGYDIRWDLVAQRWGGILITPYSWECRYAVPWYYTWDVASACIWDLSLLREEE